MPDLFSRRPLIIFPILTMLSVLFACQLGSAPGTPVAPGTVEPIATVERPVPPDLVFGPGAFNMTDAAAGLSALPSYRAVLTVGFKGTKNGKPSQWSRTYTTLVNREPPARQVTVETTGDSPDQIFLAEVNGASYERRGKNNCTASVIDPGSSLAEKWEPAGFMSGVIGAEAAGSETVNGVPAAHYTFDERALGQSKIAKSTGEMWVASDGGYIVKYVLTTTGTGDYFGENNAGTLTWDYELTDVGKPVSIELPKDCPPGMVDAPLLPDAANTVRSPGLLAYETASSLADAAAFYQKQLPDLGWKPDGDPAITDTKALLNFKQGTQTIMVIISAEASPTTVRIVLSP